MLSSMGASLQTPVPVIVPQATSSSITHGSPFASHPFLPPTGAPGFTGDRNWNERGFNFDKKTMEKQESVVALKGRKELTVPVLNGHLAGLVGSPS